MGKRALFLDRDGVLLETYPEGATTRGPRSLKEMRLLPLVGRACERLAQTWRLVMVTNQPDVARGIVEESVVETLNRRLRRELWLSGIYVCYHDDADNCECRKPKPGLLLRAATVLGISLPDSIMVGDRETDTAAGKAAGCRTLMIGGPHKSADYWSPSLFAAMVWLEGKEAYEDPRPQSAPLRGRGRPDFDRGACKYVGY